MSDARQLFLHSLIGLDPQEQTAVQALLEFKAPTESRARVIDDMVLRTIGPNGVLERIETFLLSSVPREIPLDVPDEYGGFLGRFHLLLSLPTGTQTTLENLRQKITTWNYVLRLEALQLICMRLEVIAAELQDLIEWTVDGFVWPPGDEATLIQDSFMVFHTLQLLIAEYAKIVCPRLMTLEPDAFPAIAPHVFPHPGQVLLDTPVTERLPIGEFPQDLPLVMTPLPEFATQIYGRPFTVVPHFGWAVFHVTPTGRRYRTAAGH
ncbi:hypothetical protein EW146_g4530 [Bondarzewia mesenterica]|uniref:Uncharacterized protein n=1 Tax=Bondarzewia mesenterica TaxID=1095465 RepID=A0A4S4M010_9AGAM|nr:hypothetical protein EW146_g4530 [Bondarzewia mesenterica]